MPLYQAGAPDRLARRSRWHRALPGDVPVDSSGLGAWLAGLPLPRAVLMPCSDAWAGAVAGLAPETSRRFPACIARPSVLATLVDKGLFFEALKASGVPHPRTAFLRRATDLGSVLDDDLKGAFLKPRVSHAFFKIHRVKAFHVADRADAVHKMKELEAADLEMLLQEYVPGPPTCHYFVDGFVDRSGAVRACFARRRLRMHPPDFGNSTYMVSVPLEEAAGAVRGVTALLTHLGYRGIFSAEFKRDPRDGVFKILEVNARPWWYVGFAAHCGVDVCSMAYRDALGLDVEDVREYAVGKTCVYPEFDIHATAAQRRSGEMTWREWTTACRRAWQPIYSPSDPGPTLWDFGSGVVRRVRAAFSRKA